MLKKLLFLSLYFFSTNLALPSYGACAPPECPELMKCDQRCPPPNDYICCDNGDLVDDELLNINWKKRIPHPHKKHNPSPSPTPNNGGDDNNDDDGDLDTSFIDDLNEVDITQADSEKCLNIRWSPDDQDSCRYYCFSHFQYAKCIQGEDDRWRCCPPFNSPSLDSFNTDEPSPQPACGPPECPGPDPQPCQGPICESNTSLIDENVFHNCPYGFYWNEKADSCLPILLQNFIVNENGIKMTITAADVSNYLKSNPQLQHLLFQHFGSQLNQASLIAREGSLIFSDHFGQIEHNNKKKCIKVKIHDGWSLRANIHPKTNVRFSFGWDGSAVVFKLSEHLDAEGAFDGQLSVYVSKKIIGNRCLPQYKVNTKTLSIGADIRFTIISALKLSPNIYTQGEDLVIGFKPEVVVGGDLEYFKPHAAIDVRVFGVRIGALGKFIEREIKVVMKRQFTQQKFVKGLVHLQNTLQSGVNSHFGNDPTLVVLKGMAFLTEFTKAVQDINANQNNW